MNQSDAYAAKIEDVELYLLTPDLATAYRVEREATDMRLLRGPLLQDTLSVKANLHSTICGAAYGSKTAIRDEWEDWVFALYVRGGLKFEGPVVGGKVEWGGRYTPGQQYEHPGSHVELVAEHWFTHHLRRRYIASTTGAQYVLSDTPNRVFCDLIRTSSVSGAVVTPSFPVSWQQGSEVRHDMGNVTVACSLPTAAGTSIDYRNDVGQNVLDALLELCNVPADEADKLWPAWSRSGTTITYSVLRGRSGAGRQIGTDHGAGSASPIEVSAERQNLIGYSLAFDRTKKENHIHITGKGRHVGQMRWYEADLADIAERGVFEGYENLTHARAEAELELEGQRLLSERVRGVRKQDWRVTEASGFQWPTHFDIGDTLAMVVPVGQVDGASLVSPQIVETNIIGLEWALTAPGPARITLTLGQWPPTPERELGRSGGGGGGGRGGGGRPRSKAGESDQDPDDIRSYATVQTQNGDVDAEGPNHVIKHKGKDEATYVRDLTWPTDSANSDNPASPDIVEHEIVATFFDATVDVNGHIRVRLDDGNEFRVPGALVSVGPGG